MSRCRMISGVYPVESELFTQSNSLHQEECLNCFNPGLHVCNTLPGIKPPREVRRYQRPPRVPMEHPERGLRGYHSSNAHTPCITRGVAVQAPCQHAARWSGTRQASASLVYKTQGKKPACQVCSLARAFRSFGILQKGQPGKVLGAVHSTTPCSTYFLLPDSPPGLRLELNQPNPMRYIYSDVHLISRNTWVSLPRLASPHLGQDTSSHLEPQLPNTHPPASASLTAKVPTEMFLPLRRM